MKKNTLEMMVGLFLLIGFSAFAYLALQLGEIPFLTNRNSYILRAEFDNVAGIKRGASVRVAGVVIGEVVEITLDKDLVAILSLSIDKNLEVPVDSMGSIKSQGIIGEKYVQLSMGGDEEIFAPNELLKETESAIDIESLISKFAFGSAK